MDRGNLTYAFPLFLCLSAIICGYTIDPYHSWGGDFALYIQQAEALLHGNTKKLLEVNAYAMNHSELVLGPDLYPPGFPLLLVPIVALWGKNLLAMKLLVVVCFILFQWVLYRYSRKYFSPYLSLVMLCCFSLNPWLIRYCNFVISDIPFLLFSMLSLWYMRKFWEGDRSIKAFLVLGLSMGFACLIRSVGIVLLGTFILLIFLSFSPPTFPPKRKIQTSFRGLQILVISFLLLGASEVFYPSGTSSYLAYLSSVSLSQVGQNARYYLSLPYLHLGRISLLVYLIAPPFLLLGIRHNYRTHLPEFLFCCFYFCTLLVWPFTDGVRFIFPLLPFLILFSMLGALKWVSKRLNYPKLGRYKSTLLGSFAGLLLLICIIFTARGSLSGGDGKVGSPASLEVFEFIQEKIPTEEKLSFFRPRILRLYTEREGLAFTELSNALHHQISYHVLNLSEEAQSLDEFNQRIFANEEFEIWRRRP